MGIMPHRILFNYALQFRFCQVWKQFFELRCDAMALRHPKMYRRLFRRTLDSNQNQQYDQTVELAAPLPHSLQF